jgi:hypothetical protein
VLFTPIVRCETGEGDAVSLSKRAKAGRKSEMEMRGRRATREAELPGRGCKVESYWEREGICERIEVESAKAKV